MLPHELRHFAQNWCIIPYLMAIESGKKFGPYEILSPLGSGGMGEVYSARDTRLDRTVAIKVLPAHLSSNPDLRQRFEREARAISSLNHPHICTLHDIGQENDTVYLVMEFIEGETLSSRLQKGFLSLTDLLRYSIQISEALDKAHRHGIIHRDLKPGNIMLTKGGVKLLDFGLAKLANQEVPSEVSQLATAHHELTKEGTILGTLQYMAPEQLEGKDTDARTDIFALGTVMYEMATGKKAFEGSSQASLIAAILKEEPNPMSQLQPLTPIMLERVVKTCLEKDPDDRWQSAHDISKELRWITESSISQSSIQVLERPIIGSKGNRFGWVVAGLLALALLASWGWFRFAKEKTHAPTATEIRFSISPERSMSLTGLGSGRPDFAVSHDGTRLIYSVDDSKGRLRRGPRRPQLWLRSLSSPAAQPLPGTEGAELPFWSPDDQHIAFVLEHAMRKIPLSGGTPQFICNVEGAFLGGHWLADGTIVYSSGNSGLRRVSAGGGQPQPFTTLDKSRGDLAHSFPLFLPDGRNFLYTCDSDQPERRGIYLGSLDSKEVTRISDSRYKVAYVSPGYLLFIRGTTLFAQRLRTDPPKLLGDPIVVADNLSLNSNANGAPFNSSNRTVLYSAGGSWASTQLAWFDRSGKLLGNVGPVGSDISVSLSPDRSRAAVAGTTGSAFRSGAGEEVVNIWVIDLVRNVRTRITFDPATSDENPTWSPDGKFLAFASHRNADRAAIYKKAASGGGSDQPFYPDITENPHPESWSTDGKFLLIQVQGVRQTNIFALDLNSATPNLIPYMSTPSNDSQGQFSPDGKWVAYTSDESGINEIYVRPFPKGDGKWQISDDGGSEPRWRGDGKELFYLTPTGTMMAVPVSADSSSFHAAPPVTLFKTATVPIPIGSWGSAAQYDVTKDGSKFLINTIVDPPTLPNLYVIANWQPPQ